MVSGSRSGEEVGWSGVEQGWWASVWVGRLTCKAAGRGQGPGVELPVCVCSKMDAGVEIPLAFEASQTRSVCVVGGMVVLVEAARSKG